MSAICATSIGVWLHVDDEEIESGTAEGSAVDGAPEDSQAPSCLLPPRSHA